MATKNINLLTNKTLLDSVLTALRSATPLSAEVQLHPHQLAYYVQRVDPAVRLRDQKFAGGPFTDLSVQDGWGIVKAEKEKPLTNATRALLDELRFMEGFGFAVSMPDEQVTITNPDNTTRDALYKVYAVSLAAVSELYGTAPPAVTTGRGMPAGTDGIFTGVNDGTRAEKVRNLMQLLIKLVLPGMFWRNYYATHGLASDIHLTHKLGGEMLEMSVLWDKLVRVFGFN
jgi:hypothetical protein